ncbi:Conserved_hypothetical protein [Hexamita inflata]|uniref:Transmembrane protein n=1 Tax=Hexamita inflata TaxID=28002 RepID=A0AA86NIM2_9EUKA|nr:Conserved hypothetical protein [Hexamita inflata]
MISILILTYQNCLDASHGNIAQLTGILKQYTWYLNFSIKQNCSQLVGNNMQVQLRFQNQQLPLNMIQIQTKLNQTGFQIIQFVQDELTYKKLLHIASVDYIVLIDQIQQIGVVHNVKQIRVDTRQCWDKVTFSADRDWAFNISVVPNNCIISKSVSVTLEYFKEQWLSVPIIPTNAVGSFQGFQSGDFIVNNVLFFNTSADLDIQNAQLIIQFVEYFKENFNVRLRMKVQENDNLNNILNLFQVDIQYLGNQLSKLAQPQSPTCTVDTWYAFTITINQPLLVSTLSKIQNGFTVYCQQYTYDEDKQFENISSFTQPLTKFGNRKGIIYSFNGNLEINYSKKYYFQTFIQLLDRSGKMLASVYYSGQAALPCFSKREYHWYDDKVCMKSFLQDTPLCRSVYTEQTGIQGMFVGLESDKADPQDPDLRKTFFYMKINQTLTNDWFGRYNMICVGEKNSTGQFSGSNVTYGTFSQRIYDFGQYILRQESNITVSLLFRTNYEVEYITAWASHMVGRAFKWVYVVLFGVFVSVSGAFIVFYKFFKEPYDGM